MTCDEILTRAADFAGDADVERHLAACEACRDAVGAAREGLDVLSGFETAEALRETPGADADAVWRSVRRPRFRTATWALRAAVVLLAATGALALAGVEIRTPAPRLVRADVDAAVESGIAKLVSRLDARDAARAGEVRDVADWLDERRRADVDALVAEIVSLRREVAALRFAQDSLTASAMPALPDPR